MYKLLFILITCFWLCSCSLLNVTATKYPNSIDKISNKQNILLKIKWEYNKLKSSNPLSFTPFINNNTIYTSDQSGKIISLDQSDGVIIKKYHIKEILSSGTASSIEHIFVCTQSGKLLAINKVKGSIDWQVTLPTISIETPQVTSKSIIVKTIDASVMSYNINTGNLLWIFQKANSPLTLRSYNSFKVISDDAILLGQPSGRLILLNAITGSPIWEIQIANTQGATDLDKVNDVAIRPVLFEKEVCVSSYNGKLACLDIMTGTLLWSKDFSTSKGLVIDESNLYIVDNDGLIYAFDKNTGRLLWQNKELINRELSSVAFINEKLFTIDEFGNIFIIDNKTGNILSITATNYINGVSDPISINDSIIIQSGNGIVARVEMDKK